MLRVDVDKVKSSNNDGVWDTTPVELKIKVIPPIWKTSYAKIFYLLCVLGLLFAFRRFTIIKTTKKYDLELEHMEKEKKEARARRARAKECTQSRRKQNGLHHR